MPGGHIYRARRPQERVHFGRVVLREGSSPRRRVVADNQLGEDPTRRQVFLQEVGKFSEQVREVSMSVARGSLTLEERDHARDNVRGSDRIEWARIEIVGGPHHRPCIPEGAPSFDHTFHGGKDGAGCARRD